MRKRRIEDMVVVITGASSGIGEATALAFAERGARLVLAARDASAIEGVAYECRSRGAEAIAVSTDVTDSEAVQKLADRAVEFGGSIDVWVSNVGVGAVGRFHETPMAAHEQVIRANLIGHMNDAHAAVPVFLDQGFGTFINMISLGGFQAAPYAAAYSASKFGLRGFSEALRAELRHHRHIHVCDVYPAFVDTPGISHGANYMGRELSAPPPVSDARTVAAAIIGLAERPRNEVTIGIVTDLVRLGHMVAPNLMARGLGRFMESYFRRAPKTRMDDGNLFLPPSDPGGIDGGLRNPRQRHTALAAAAVAIPAAVLLTLAVTQDRRSSHQRG